MKKPMAWIYTIARNECYLYLRRKTCDQQYDDNIALPENINIHTKMILEQLFEQLNDREREIIIMYSLWGLKQYWNSKTIRNTFIYIIIMLS